jgi:hypothetical protein
VNVLQCLHVLAPDTLSAQDSYGRTLAHVAAVKDQVNVVRCLHLLERTRQLESHASIYCRI